MNAQGTDAWRCDRLGKVTASRVADVLAKTKTGWAASRERYETELIMERLSGIPATHIETPEMRWGKETEAQARALYVWERDVEVVEVGFIDHPFIKNSGASPDGLIGTDGLLETKCPSSHRHLETLMSRTIPQRYILQMYWQGACLQRKWCDYVSFDPRFNRESMQLYIQRVEFDPAITAQMERDVSEFLAGIDEKVERLEKQFNFSGKAA
jgi:hypothetical protein